MGPNAGNGVGGMELGPMMQGNGSNLPQATEYTLQGVMRFLQTEWHRHERDRNAWEIEKQEMKGRIANLEGQARRADATQRALKKYVSILERKVKDQAAQLKGTAATDAAEAAKNDRAAKIQEKLRSSLEHPIPGVDGIDSEKIDRGGDEEGQRQDLKTFLDQCQSEFMYLMIAPANPQPPPRDSPPLPMMEDLREVESYGMPAPQPMEREFQLPSRPAQNHVQEMNSRAPPPNHAPPMQPGGSHFTQKTQELQPPPMVRSSGDHQPGMYQNSNDWPTPVNVTTRPLEEGPSQATHAAEVLGGMEDPAEIREKNHGAPETDGWEFPEGTFPEPGSSHPNQTANRPDTDVFPNADSLPKSPNRVPGSHRRRSSMTRRRSAEHELALNAAKAAESGNFKLRFGLRGHLDTVRTVIFSGGGSPGEPEICTAGDDGMIKRFHIPRFDAHGGSLAHAASDLDVTANFTHRGHSGAVLCLTSWSPAPNFSTGGRAVGDGWIFSGGQDATIRVWERGRVDPKATLEGHTDAVWAISVLPATLGSVFGSSSPYGSTDRILVVSGAADGSVRLWSVSAPPQLSSPQPGTNRAMTGRGGRVRGNSMSSGSGFASTPQPTTASNSPFSHTLVHNITRPDNPEATPTCITPLDTSGTSFVVSYSDAAIITYDTRTGERIGHMESVETYDGTIKTSVNAVVATTLGLDQGSSVNEDEQSTGATGGGRSMAGSGVEGTIISGHEDRFVRFFDANSGQCTYNMIAHPDAISSLSLSPDGRELVSAGHDASLRFWSLEKRTCTQEVTSHRLMRGEGICACVWSQDGKWVVSAGGDGVVKVFAR
ncbi:WD40-repeat-containing domain protein [Dactylonectria estremocensis]|uniref:WD40-repeat-containing domain protein n=1 Tax=Dactylonectria estremocensis TaxID=1079267 RepID=A0A9P9E9J4_9HYPO|nr:WD40-repeat-containing domain protein [Dactylonectria estremocensis]